MIRQHISAAHICLTCQIRLGQRPLQSSIRKAYSTGLVADEENGRGTSNDQTDHNGELDNNRETESYSGRSIDATGSRESPPNHLHRHVSRRFRRLKLSDDKPSTPNTKVYGHTGLQKVGDNVKLSVDALGKSAEVLILRDSKLKFYKQKTKGINEDAPPESFDIFARIQSERGLISSKDVATNINEFKTRGETLKTWDDFNELAQSLQDSFTHAQMRQYIQSYPREERMVKVPSLGSGIPDKEKTTVRATPWIPEISPIDQPIDPSPLRGYSPPSYNHKQILAARILRECWKLEVPELVEGIGEVEVQTHIEDLDFLISQGYVEALIQRYYLNEPEKIEVYRPRKVLRITSTREKSAFIVSEIENGVRSIIREKIQLKELYNEHLVRGWEARDITPSVLAKLGELTKTEIRRLHIPEPILEISSMVTDGESKMAQRTDVAKRLLLDLARCDEGDHNSRKIGLRNVWKDVSPKIDLPGGPGGFVRYPESRELPWHQKLRTWSRWTAATPKSTSSEPLYEKVEYTYPFENSNVKVRGKSRNVSDLQSAEYLWSHEYKDTTTIKVGTLLHCITGHRIGKYVGDDGKPSSGYGTMPPGTTLNMMKLETEMQNSSRRIFSAQAPSLSGLFQSNSIDNKGVQIPKHEIFIYFKPNPWALAADGEPIGPSAFKDFPRLELSFKIDPKSFQIKFDEFNAIMSTEIADLMLPGLKADLQFQRTLRSSMWSGDAGLDSAPNALQEFIENSHLDLTSDQQLETPPKLVVSLAKHLCTGDGWFSMAGNNEGLGGIEVEYLFSRLEYRKTASYNFEDERIYFTSIESGKAGGSRLELSLNTPSMPKKDDFNKTMENVLRMIELMHMENITTVYGQVREVFPDFKPKPVILKPGERRFIPRRPSDFLEVKKHYKTEEERKARFEKKPGGGEDDY